MSKDLLPFDSGRKALKLAQFLKSSNIFPRFTNFFRNAAKFLGTPSGKRFAKYTAIVAATGAVIGELFHMAIDAFSDDDDDHDYVKILNALNHEYDASLISEDEYSLMVIGLMIEHEDEFNRDPKLLHDFINKVGSDFVSVVSVAFRAYRHIVMGETTMLMNYLDNLLKYMSPLDAAQMIHDHEELTIIASYEKYSSIKFYLDKFREL